MKSEYKKIIAREFLIFLCAITLSFTGVLIPTVQNYSLNKEYDSITDRVTAMERDFNNYKIKQQNHEWIFEKMRDNWDVEGWTVDSMWSQLKESIAIEKGNYKWSKRFINNEADKYFESLGFTPASLYSFVSRHSFTKSETHANKNFNSLYRERASIVYKMNEKSDFLDYFNLFMIISFSILFAARYLFISIKWSVQQIKS